MSLWSSEDSERWQQQLDGYWDTIGRSSKERLPELERWYFEELPALLKERSPAYLEKADLVRLVEWKLVRGKWRPRLQQYAQQLGEAEVKDATMRGLALLAHTKQGQQQQQQAQQEGKQKGDQQPPLAVSQAAEVEKALTIVTGLKGVGPATGSAILSAFDSSIPWMSDEAMAAALGSKDYTVKKFKELLEALRKKAAKLTSCGGRAWTAREVEQCLFAEAAGAAAKAKSDKQPPRKKQKR
ncbi:hypothetical protein N2152v2_010350 [Parachlorella kessleri]